MSNIGFPDNLVSLYIKEEHHRSQAISTISARERLLLPLCAIERAMTLAKIVVEYPTEDEDFKVLKMLSIRMFNAFGACLKLITAGYHQNSGMIMRDILETIFLLDFFNTDKSVIERWRFADKKTQKEAFSPAAIRKALDQRDGTNSKKREEAYKMFSELAAHPNMHSQHMLRPEKGGDIVMGPFMELTSLEAGITELGRLGIQAGEVMDDFLPKDWDPEGVRISFAQTKRQWTAEFYPSLVRKSQSPVD